MKLGEILVMDGLLSNDQLNLALEIQKKTGEFFGNILTKKNWVTESQLLRALGKQFDIPYASLDFDEIDWTAPAHYVSSLMGEHCFPFREDKGSVGVAISNPLDVWTISLIESHAKGRQVRLFLSPQSKIDMAINEFRRRSLHGKG